ncbi:MAG TPA: PQQ-binding-like beta-propeller repeat protein [Acidimicrobiales bacterium]|jgi:outer membrane protein assembly factor BamB|nr:PQQ-binding-like beta-propeller repeat protein [Acidimicrobiales bacterium]
MDDEEPVGADPGPTEGPDAGESPDPADPRVARPVPLASAPPPPPFLAGPVAPPFLGGTAGPAPPPFLGGPDGPVSDPPAALDDRPTVAVAALTTFDDAEAPAAYLEPGPAPVADPTIEQAAVVATGRRAATAAAQRLLTRRVALPAAVLLVVVAVLIGILTDSHAPRRPVGVQEPTSLPTTGPTVETGTLPVSGPTTTAPVKVRVKPKSQSAVGSKVTLTPGVIVAAAPPTTGTHTTTSGPSAFAAPSDLIAYAAGGGTAQVSWVAPATSGGAPVTTYRVVTVPATRTVVVDGTINQTQLQGLNPNTAYAVSVVATNAEDAISPAAATELVNGAGTGQSSLWDTAHGNLMRTGQSAFVGPASAKESWAWAQPAGATMAGDPLIGPSGNTYVALSGTDATVQVLSPTGQPVWSWTDSGHTVSGVAIGPDGTAYLATDEGIASITVGRSTPNWKFTDPRADCTYLSPLTVVGATIYASDSCGLITRIATATGQEVGPAPFGSANSSSNYSPIAFSADGKTLYQATAGGVTAWTIGGASPVQAWTGHATQVPSGVVPTETAAVGADGNLYETLAAPSGGHGYISSLTAGGVGRWTFTTAAPVEGTPAVTATGLVVAGDTAGDLYALDAGTGHLVWTHPGAHPSDNFAASSPVVAADGTIYVQSLGSIQAFSNSGALLWTAPVASAGASSPALTPGGALVVVTQDQLISF